MNKNSKKKRSKDVFWCGGVWYVYVWLEDEFEHKFITTCRLLEEAVEIYEYEKLRHDIILNFESIALDPWDEYLKEMKWSI